MIKSILFAAVYCIGAYLSFGARGLHATPFDDAAAVWRMDGPADAKAASLTPVGKAKLGVALTGTDLAMDRQRGGSGKVAEFDGGYLIAGDPAAQSPNLDGSKATTLCIRMRDPEGLWSSPLFSSDDKSRKSSAILYPGPANLQIGARELRRIKDGRRLEYLWQTEPLENRVIPGYMEKDSAGFFKQLTSHKDDAENFIEGKLRVGVPVELINPGAWHDIIVRFTGPRLEMFIDGVLVDEEFPHGSIQNLKGPFLIGAAYANGQLKCGFHGQVAYVALWNRAITDGEIQTLSGGEKEVERRDVEILGEKNDRLEGSQLQDWRPRGYNLFVGDCMTFSHDGVFHVFYLLNRKHGIAKWGMGACSWAHISTRDLVHWHEEPVAIPMTLQTENSLGTGYIIFHHGTYYAYYVQHGRRCLYKDAPYLGDNVFVATSNDCVHFTKNLKPVACPQYNGVGDINPIVFADASDQHFFMNLAGRKNYTSDDLLHWTETPVPSLTNNWMCPSVFEWNHWHYYAGCGYYHMAQQPPEIAKWIDPSYQGLQDGLIVPMVAKFKDNRYILVGTTPDGGNYAHEMAFRELVQEKDGTLGEKWPAEMIPKTGAPLDLACKPVSGDVTTGAHRVRLSSAAGTAAAMLTDVPQNVRITVRVIPSPGIQSFGLFCRAEGNIPNGSEIRFEPAASTVKGGTGIPDSPINKWEQGIAKLAGVQGLDHPFTLDIIVKDNLIDFCVDNRRTGIFPVNRDGDPFYILELKRGRIKSHLFFYANHGEVTFDNIQVRPLAEK
jgi:hypothetical protein